MGFRQVVQAVARRDVSLWALLFERERLRNEREAQVRADAEAPLRAELVDMRRRAEPLQAELEHFRSAHRFVPPGHFYSPLPAAEDIERDAARLFPEMLPRTLPGIDLREAEQMRLLEDCRTFYAEMPFTPERQARLRYRFDNDAFSYADAIFLYFMLRHLRPKRVIEVGSGHSSCVMLDTDEFFLGGATEFVFIEPYPDLLYSLLKPGDTERITIHPKRLQDVPLSVFEALGEGDILFIDSTHVAKLGSDVCFLFAEILPALRPGVVVHVHDIFYPFEYPRYWFEEGRAWNEAYLLRAFLQTNSAFQIELWNHFISVFHRDFLAEAMPLCLRNPGAGLWMRRVR